MGDSARAGARGPSQCLRGRGANASIRKGAERAQAGPFGSPRSDRGGRHQTHKEWTAVETQRPRSARGGWAPPGKGVTNATPRGGRSLGGSGHGCTSERDPNAEGGGAVQARGTARAKRCVQGMTKWVPLTLPGTGQHSDRVGRPQTPCQGGGLPPSQTGTPLLTGVQGREAPRPRQACVSPSRCPQSKDVPPRSGEDHI